MKIRGTTLGTRKTLVTSKSFTDKTVTSVEVAVNLGTVLFTATGNSKRMAGDKYNQVTGDLLAAARAVHQLDSMLQNAIRNLD